MADPLSISASVAGLITIADIVIRNGYKYIKAVKNADKAVVSLMYEVNLLSGTLHSLRNVAEGFENEIVPFKFTTQIHHVEYCHQTLRKINGLLDTFEPSKAKGVLQTAAQRLRWPLSISETRELMAEVERHRATLSLALQADGLSILLKLLAKEDTIGAVVSDIHRGLNRDRSQRNVLAMDKERRKIFEWLCPTGLDPAKNQESSVALRQPGTGIWFIESVEFQEWSAKTNSKLWLYGIPGAGKTILLSTIIQEVEKINGNDEGLAYFYCDYKNAETQDISKILGSLIKQFVLQDETEMAFEALRVCHKSHQYPSSRMAKPETLLELLHAVMGSFSAATVIIDGLDEISGNRSGAMELLRRINQPLCAIRTLFASRREIDIEGYLGDYEQVSIAARNSDLELYVGSEIETRTRRKQLNIKDADLKAQIMNRLINGADGMFRWVACQIDHLCELGTDKARRNALDKLPRGLPKTYERILGRVLEAHEETQDLVIKALQWLSTAENLSGRALLEALALNPGDSRLDPEAMTSEEDILKWCSSLVRRRADGNGLELAHFTVKEYLESIKPESDPRFGKFKISKPESDLLIGSICLTYLTLDSLAEAPLPVDLFDGVYADLDEGTNTHSANDKDSTDDEASEEDLQESDEELALEEMQRSEEDEEEHDSDGGESEKRETESPGARNDTPDMLFSPYLDRFPLLLFAARNWYIYCRDNLRDPVVAALTHKLFHPRKSNQFLWWSYAFMCDELDDAWSQPFSDATTLHWAAMLKLEEVCAWLTQSGSDINRGSSLGTPFDCLLLDVTVLWKFDDLEDFYWENYEPNEDDAASKINKKSIAHLLAGAGLKLNESPNSSTVWLPLQLALIADCDNSDLIALLLQAGAKVDLCALGIVERYVKKIGEIDKDHVPNGYLALFEKVTADEVQEDARPTFSTLSEKLSPHGLQRPQLWETLKLGSASAAVDVSELKDWFFQAMEYGQIDDARTLMTLVRDRLPSADSERVLGTGLRIAARNGHEHVVNDMLESGVDPKMVDSDGDSTLHCSLFDVHDVSVVIRIVEALLARGADLNLKNNKDELVFHLAAKSKQNGLFKAVVEVAGDQAIQIILGSSNPSVLQYAVEMGSDETVSYLLDIYTDIDENKHRSKAGYWLLGMAARRETAPALRQLLSRGLSIKALDADGSSVLYNAVTMGKLETFSALMEAGATDNSSREDRRRAVHAAAESVYLVSLSMLETLLSAGEDPNATTNDGYTPLQLTLPRPNRGFTEMRVSKIKLLMEQSGISLNCTTRNGGTPLMSCLDCLAIMALNGEQTKWTQKDALQDSINVLIDHSTNLNLVDDNGATALHHICLGQLTKVSFDVIKTLVTRGSILHHRNRAGVTPFEMLLCSSMKKLGEPNGGDPNENLSVIEVLRFIIVHMPAHRLNDHLSNGLPPLADALKSGCADAVELLLSMDEVDVDARSRDKNQISPLEIAAHDGCSETVARTLYSRSNHSIRSHSPVQGYTILHFAARERGSQAFLRMLVQETSDLDLEIRDRYGRTPLGLAILVRSLGAVSLLLEAGADVNNSSTVQKLYPLHLAADRGFLSIAEILIQYKAEVNVRGYMGVTPLIMAARKGFDQIIERLVKAGAEISPHSEDGESALLAAALNQHWGTSKLLINLGADVNDVFSKTKETVLHLASQRSTWKIVQFLLKKGADQEASDLLGLTPFLKSALARRWDIVERYLEHGTNLDAKTLSGWTAMHYAIWGGAKETVELLHKHGAPLLQDIRDQRGILTGSSLTCAVVSGDPGVFQLISEEEAALDFEGDEGWIITHYAVQAQKDAVRELLLSHNLDWEPLTAKFHDNKFNIAKVTPLHIAALRGNDGSFKFLKHNGLIQNIDVRTSQVHCYTPLHLATISHHLSTVKLLLEFGADVDRVDGLDEKTALHHAAELGFADIVQVMLKHGCHPNMLDANGMTPELLAIENSHTEITKMLAQHLDSLEAPVEATATTTTAAETSTMMMAPAPAVTPPWRLPLCRGPYVRKVLTGDVSIYAVDNTTCPPALRDLLEQHEGKEVDRLGTPYKR